MPPLSWVLLSPQQTLSMATVAMAMVALAMVAMAMVAPPFLVSITELVYLATSMVLVYRTTIHHRLLLQE